MIRNAHADELAQLRTLVEAQQAQLTAQQGRLARLERQRRRPRRRAGGRLGAAIAVALLVALVPLGLLAAGPFIDLNAGPDHADANVNIQLIADAGITKGCDPPAYVSYCPNDAVTREQMASFLARTAGLGTNPPVANAKTAQTATNAAQLGGVAASAYLKTGAVKATQVFNNQPGPSTGPAPRGLSASFNSNGGTLIIHASGSGYRGSAGIVTMIVGIDGIPAGAMSAYTNEANSHKAFVANPLVVTGVGAGTHTLILTTVSGANATNIDATDFFSATVVELP